VCDVDDAGLVWFRIADLLDVNESGIADDVGVRHEAVGADEKTGSVTAAHAADIPRHTIVGLLCVHFHANDGIKLNFGDVRLNRLRWRYFNDRFFHCFDSRPKSRSRSDLLRYDER